MPILQRRKLRLRAVKHCAQGHQKQYAPSKEQKRDENQGHLACLGTPLSCLSGPLIHISWRAVCVHIHQVRDTGCSLGLARGAGMREVVLCVFTPLLLWP